jgi:FAD/FMN-containing dehydrogenase
VPDRPDAVTARLGRRAFLRGLGGLAGTVALGPLAAPAAGTANKISGRDWADLRRGLKGDILRPGDRAFALAAQPHNLRYAATLPTAIARCRTAEDVIAAIRFARGHDLPLVARSGGHSYAGYSTTTGLLIDLSLLADATIDPETGIARIGGGIDNGRFYRAMKRAGVATTHGRCPSVGAAGFLLGGGIGFGMRAHGIGADQLVETELVTAAGDRLVANARNNPDLFWACRGAGGGNFGINTGFSLQTFPVDRITVLRLTWTTNVEAVAPALVAALQAAPEGLGCRVALRPVAPQKHGASRDVTVGLLGQFTGTPDEAADLLAPALKVATPAASRIENRSYWDGQEFLAEPSHPNFFQERSRFLTALTPAFFTTAFAWLRRAPAAGKDVGLALFQVGGRVNAVAPGDTAFVHRSASWLAAINLGWVEKDRPTLAGMRAWQDGFYEALLKLTSGGAYQNFSDPSLADWQQAYYGTNLPRLCAVKAKLDPDFVFRFPQAIPPG